jgi:anti-sigma factor (TIGR02949 family)
MKHRHDQPPTDDIGCLQVIEWFYAWLDGELDDPDAATQIEQHMAHCRSCFTRSQLERTLTRRMRGMSAQRAPETLKARLRDLLELY